MKNSIIGFKMRFHNNIGMYMRISKIGFKMRFHINIGMYMRISMNQMYRATSGKMMYFKRRFGMNMRIKAKKLRSG